MNRDKIDKLAKLLGFASGSAFINAVLDEVVGATTRIPENSREDCIQAICVVVLISLERFDAHRSNGNWRSWVRAVIGPQVAQFWREFYHPRSVRSDPMSNQSVETVSDRAEAVHELLSNRELEDRLPQAVASLLPDQRSVITMRFFEDMTWPQTAACMGLSESAVRRLSMKAFENLRKVLLDGDDL